MSNKGRIAISDIVQDIMFSIEDDDFLSNTSEVVVTNYARRALKDMDFDFGQNIKSSKQTVNTVTQTVNLPSDCVDIVKIGVVGSDGMVYVLANNKNINYSHSEPTTGGTDSVPDKTPTATPGGSSDSEFNQFIFHNYFANGTYGQLYGLGGGQRYGEYRVNWDQLRIEFSSTNNLTEVVLEYLTDNYLDASPFIHTYAEEALRAYIYYRLIERKASVPMGEKQRARKEYYNELRKAKARLSSFTKEDALQVIRKNFKQSPKL
tara:strand:- start:15265 stop:16053 length:789 start_codon:yes stop_codon:yes gene_type:complete